MAARHSARSGLTFALLLSVTLAAAARAAGPNDDEPIRINARSVEANDRTGVVVYRGNVVMEQGRLSILADRVEITARHGKTELVRATGNPAKLRQRAGGEDEEVRAEAGRVDYRVASGKIDMSGHVSLQRGDDLFTADVLHYDLGTKDLNAAGDDKGVGRVHAVIRPKQTEAVP
ncbi:MAG: lipopolysaccharide transport periplasmic protein LptA [Pseudomonadota bacterium]